MQDTSKQTVADRTNEVREIEHCWITLSDGIRLSARLWLPEMPAEEPTPALFEYIPYRKRDLSRLRDERNHAFFARRGYACVRVDMRGSGDSEGAITDMYSVEELDDAIEVIAWIAGQPWCNGAVGMMGTSWGGTSSLQAAARRPDALKAVIAVCATNNRFDDDIHHMGGCVLTDTVEWGATLPAILASPPDPKTAGAQWRRIWQERLDALSFPLEDWIKHETCDAYWRWGAVNETPDAIACPVLAIGGWSDRYSNTVMNLLAQSHDRCWGIVGAWGHHYPDAGCPGPGIRFQQEALRWWDRWLNGLKNGIDQEPHLRAWLQEYQPPRDKIEHRRGRWISEHTWPSNNISPRDFWLRSGRLETEPGFEPETAIVPSALQVGAASGDTGYFGREGGLPLDQQEDDAFSLVFETDQLEQPIDIVGSVHLEVSLESDQPIAALVARLNDVPPHGAIARVAYVVRNLALDDDGQGPHSLAGETKTFLIDFPNTAYRFAKGHRIRLALSSSYWPLIWPSPRPVRITLQVAQTRLTLPVRPVEVRDVPVSFDAPLDDAGDSAVRVLSAAPLKRWTRLDTEGACRTTQWHQPFRQVRFSEIDLDFGFETQGHQTIRLDDPNSASTQFEHRLHYRRGNWSVEVIGVAQLTSTETAYNLAGAVEVRENDRLVFERRWAPVVTRTCA